MIGKAQIERVATNGPFAYIFYVNGLGNKAEDNIANLNAAIDAIKPLAGALAGTITSVTIHINTDG